MTTSFRCPCGGFVSATVTSADPRGSIVSDARAEASFPQRALSGADRRFFGRFRCPCGGFVSATDYAAPGGSRRRGFRCPCGGFVSATAKSISDASWSVFLRAKLAHAVVKTGARLVTVDARNTTKTCSRCGWLWESMMLEDRVFRCEKCGLALDRDDNAARNIIRVGRDTAEVTRGETRASAFGLRHRQASGEDRVCAEARVIDTTCALCASW